MLLRWRKRHTVHSARRSRREPLDSKVVGASFDPNSDRYNAMFYKVNACLWVNLGMRHEVCALQLIAITLVTQR